MRLSDTYTTARTEFFDAATAAGATIVSHEHPGRGPEGATLATDVAVLGRPDARHRLLVISGTHGVEGFAGSMCESTWLRDGIALRDDLAVVVIHAINPYGFAWVRRVNEDNVDLNRNCVDFERGLPPNPGYDELAKRYLLLLPSISRTRELLGSRTMRPAASGARYHIVPIELRVIDAQSETLN